jgi:DNA-directed RNA polymerase specialized sigma24 family protein
LLDGPYDSQFSSVRPLDLRRYRAERLLRKDFTGLRAKVLAVVRSQLSGKGIVLDRADLEACYAQAWHGLYASLLEGKEIENPAGWLVRVTFRRAVDEHRAACAAGLGEGEGRGSYPPRSNAPQDLAAELDDKARLRHLFEGLRTRLSARELEAASLCYLQGLTRAQAAERMGTSEARMRKLMEGAGAGKPGVAGKMGELLGTIAAGGWCEEQSSLMKAYAFGILDPEGERYGLAVAHCKECPACRAHVACLRGLASVLPLPLLPKLVAVGGDIAAGRSGMAGRAHNDGWNPARRIATGVSRLGGKVGGGLNGLQGSLAAKLVVTVALVLGTGYAVLDSRAHGSPHRVSAPFALTPSSAGVGVLRHSPFGVPHARAHVRVGHPNRVNTTSRSHHSRAPLSPARTAIAPAPEFGPERTAGATALTPAPQDATPTQAERNGSPAGEFGVE